MTINQCIDIAIILINKISYQKPYNVFEMY